MNFIKFIKTRQGRIIISILYGLGLSCLFRKVCTGRNCIVYRAPNPSTIVNNVYQHNGKCYQYKTESTNCTHDTIRSN